MNFHIKMTDTSSHLDLAADAFGLNKLPKAVRDALLEEIDAVIFRSVLFRVITKLDEKEKDELHEILEETGDDFEKPFEFLKMKTENFDEIVGEEIEKIKEESLSLTQQFA